jgi:hypothetical protein
MRVGRLHRETLIPVAVRFALASPGGCWASLPIDFKEDAWRRPTAVENRRLGAADDDGAHGRWSIRGKRRRL